MKRSERIAAATLAPFVVVAVARIVAHDAWLPLVWVNSLTEWLYLPAWGLLVWSVYRRSLAIGVGSALVAALHVLWVAPGLFSEGGSVPHPSEAMRIVSSNVLLSHPNPEALEAELLRYDADILVLVEVSPRWGERIEAGPLRERYPHRVVAVRSGPRGIAVLSSRPFAASRTTDLEGVPMIDVTFAEPRLRLVGLHLVPPIDAERADVWRRQLDSLRQLARSRGPLVVAGDFNATDHSRGLRELEAPGLRDVHRALGRGLATTWPNGTALRPPLRIDHVLVSESIVPVRVREGRGIGSNHAPVIVDLAIPVGRD